MNKPLLKAVPGEEKTKLDDLTMEQIIGRPVAPSKRVIFDFEDAKVSNERPKNLLSRMLHLANKSKL